MQTLHEAILLFPRRGEKLLGGTGTEVVRPLMAGLMGLLMGFTNIFF